jgi:hypothetical protein
MAPEHGLGGGRGHLPIAHLWVEVLTDRVSEGRAARPSPSTIPTPLGVVFQALSIGQDAAPCARPRPAFRRVRRSSWTPGCDQSVRANSRVNGHSRPIVDAEGGSDEGGDRVAGD